MKKLSHLVWNKSYLVWNEVTVHSCSSNSNGAVKSWPWSGITRGKTNAWGHHQPCTWKKLEDRVVVLRKRRYSWPALTWRQLKLTNCLLFHNVAVPIARHAGGRVSVRTSGVKAGVADECYRNWAILLLHDSSWMVCLAVFYLVLPLWPTCLYVSLLKPGLQLVGNSQWWLREGCQEQVENTVRACERMSKWMTTFQSVADDVLVPASAPPPAQACDE